MGMEKLQEFIAHARKKGMDHSTIRMLLLSSGWKEREVAEALSAEGLDMAVPVPPDSGGAREAFFHLVSFAALYTYVLSSVYLFFKFVEKLYPDPALSHWQSSGDLSGMRWSMAAIIVSFPLLVWMSRIIHIEILKHPEKAWSGIRRWLTYLVLFIAAFSMMIDVITLVFALLEGELTTRFLLKVLVVFVFAGLTFLYYFLALKLEPRDKRYSLLQKRFLSIASIFAMVGLVCGGVLAGSPLSQRERKFDERRLEDFRTIKNEIRNYVYDGFPQKGDRPKRAVPETLSDVSAIARYERIDTIDPETGEPYTYTVESDTVYELCATFGAERDERYDIFWNHNAGYHCFTMDVSDSRWH